MLDALLFGRNKESVRYSTVRQYEVLINVSPGLLYVIDTTAGYECKHTIAEKSSHTNIYLCVTFDCV